MFSAAELEKQLSDLQQSLTDANQALATAVESERKLNAQMAAAASNVVSCVCPCSSYSWSTTTIAVQSTAMPVVCGMFQVL